MFFRELASCVAMEELAAIERQLTEAAELHLTGTLTEGLYVAAVHGAVAALPTPAAPKHITVLKRLKRTTSSYRLRCTACCVRT